jgi:sugar lactone lactonase YvrE
MKIAIRIAVGAAALLVVIAALVTIVVLRSRSSGPKPLDTLHTIAGSGPSYSAQPFGEVFGIAVSPKGVAYFTDGQNGIVWRIDTDGTATKFVSDLATPSGIAMAPDRSIVVADSGAHTILRLDPASGEVKVIAGTTRSGYADGAGAAALFDAPVGVAVGTDGTIYVADTYNDRIRKIDKAGNVTTVAGGDGPGFVDSPNGLSARFDTPGGIAIAPDGAVIVADTGNRRIRRIGADGAVTTLSGNGDYGDLDGNLLDASFAEPIGLTIDSAGTIYVADAGANKIRAVQTGLAPIVVTLAGRGSHGLLDGAAGAAKLNRPSGVALVPNGDVMIADTGNRLVRILDSPERKAGETLPAAQVQAMRPDPTSFRKLAPGRWPYEPSDKPREIAATFGEIRGEIGPNAAPAHFHNGLDIPGAYGEVARAIRTEKALQLLPAGDTNGISEYLRLATMGYIHVRFGRDPEGKPIAPDKFQLVKGPDGKVATVRVRRGTVFTAGDPLGTLNNQNHVHLIAGPPGFEMNALAALDLPGIADKIPPVIEENGVRLYDENWKEFSGDTKNAGAKDKPIEVSGRVRIVVAAYDRMDGDSDRRKLGVYRLGYQARAVGEPLDPDGGGMTLEFAELPEGSRGVPLVYGPGSRAGAHPPTLFGYIVTDHLVEQSVTQDFWDTKDVPPGDYVVRVWAVDFFGNRTTRDLRVQVIATK